MTTITEERSVSTETRQKKRPRSCPASSMPTTGAATCATAGYRRSSGDIPLTPGQLKQFGLRKGDLIEGTRTAGQDAGQRRHRQRPARGRGRRPAPLRRPHPDLSQPAVPPRRRRPVAHRADHRPGLAPSARASAASSSPRPRPARPLVLKTIAHAIATAYPEVHLMLVLVGERPEEVTDLRRSIRWRGRLLHVRRVPRRPRAGRRTGHRARQAAGRAGRDVVVLLDSLTRLGRAYNLAAPASGAHPGGWCRRVRAAAAAPVPRRGAQPGRRRLADHPVHRPHRHRIAARQRPVRGVQGHRQHGAAAAPRPRGKADLPRDRSGALRHPPR